jgi:PAS domain S-box-containing protein
MAQRYEAVEALRESEKLYRTTVDAMSDAVHVVDRDLNIVLMNEALYENRGKWSVAGGGIGKPLFDMFPFLPNRVRQEYRRVFDTGKVLITEEATEVGGDVRWSETRKIPILDEEGEVYRVATIIRDITERKELERQTEKRRIYLESVLANAPDAIVTLDVDHRVLEWNPGAEQLFGYAKAEALGQNIDDLITGSDPEIYQEATGFTERVLSGIEVPPTESIRYCKDGRAVDVILAGSPIYAEGALVGSVVVYTDITQRREAERELEQRTAQLEALRQVSLELTAQLDLEALLRSIASRAVQLVEGKAGGFYLYRPVRDVLEFVMSIGPNPAPIGTYLEKGEGLSGRVWEQGHSITVDDYRTWEHRAVAYRGLPFTAVIGAPVRWGDEFLGVLNITADPPRVFSAQDAELLSLFATQAAIAIRNAQLYEEVRLRAEELAQAFSKLQELDRLKSQFVQNVSHEFRSPLSLIRGYADLLENGALGELQPEQEKPVAVIARRSRMLSDLVQDITLILEAEVNPPTATPVAMDELARAAVEDFQIVAQENDITLKQDIPPSLPPVSGSVHYMRRVLDNLIGNAIKFTPEGGEILVRIALEEDGVTLVVEDTGIGIAPEQQEQIFDRFYQVDGSTKRRYGGVGLGLALVKELVETYGGQVSVDSVLGQGSSFHVSLPVCDEER